MTLQKFKSVLQYWSNSIKLKIKSISRISWCTDSIWVFAEIFNDPFITLKNCLWSKCPQTLKYLNKTNESKTNIARANYSFFEAKIESDDFFSRSLKYSTFGKKYLMQIWTLSQSLLCLVFFESIRLNPDEKSISKDPFQDSSCWLSH